MKKNTPLRALRTTLRSVALTALIATPAFAQSANGLEGMSAEEIQSRFVEESGGGQRINYSGKLRMLSQRIPAAACSLNASVAPEQSKAVLDDAVAEFNRILAALEHGDEELGIFGAENRARTLRVIQEIHTKFAPLDAALSELDGGVPTDAAVQVLADGNAEVLEMAKLLVSELTGEYASPVSLRQSDAMAIDIAGRQRMLTQKASREVCQILSNVNATSSRAALQGTMEMFEVSLAALRNGMDAVGLPPPPTEEIAVGLDQVNAGWSAIKAHMDAIDAGETMSDEVRAEVFLGLNKTMVDMNAVVGLYSEASKLDF